MHVYRCLADNAFPIIPSQQLPKGAAPKKSPGANPFARYRARYFEGDNASGAPFLHAIGVMFLIGYTIDCECEIWNSLVVRDAGAFARRHIERRGVLKDGQCHMD